MITFFVRRLALMAVSIVAISILSFVLIELPPGTALDAKLEQLRQSGGDVSADQIRQLEERYGIRDPVHVKYTKWVAGLLRGDFGQSFTFDRPVKTLIFDRLAFSVALALFGLAISWLIGIPLGVYSATHRYTVPDYVIQVIQFIGVAVPEFLLALLMLVFANQVLHLEVGVIFSAQYANAPWSVGKVLDFLSHIWIPIAVIAAGSTAYQTRVMRAKLLDVLGQQYVQTARSKGVREQIVVWKHAVRNAIHPLVMNLGLALPALISGEVIVSIVLNLPTTGPLLLRALETKDMYLAIALLMMLSMLLLIGNLLADVALTWVDPRVRLE